MLCTPTESRWSHGFSARDPADDLRARLVDGVVIQIYRCYATLGPGRSRMDGKGVPELLTDSVAVPPWN